MGAIPKKYVKINGIMKMNPEYKTWKNQQNKAEAAGTSEAAKPATTVLNSSNALPVVSSMEDYEKLNEDLNADIPLSESTSATIEMLQEPEIAAASGLQPDDMIDELGKMLAKYEIPIGLTNKLLVLSEFQSLEFIIDDSGSMTLQTDTVDPTTRRNITRWEEARRRLLEMIEVVAYVPFTQIGIEFLNRKDRIVLTKDNRTPEAFFSDATSKINASFRTGPRGTTPAMEKLQESLLRGQGVNICRYFFGDGVPNGGKRAIEEIIKLLLHRENPEQNPITFISCTNEDEAVEWMKDAEEVRSFVLLLLLLCQYYCSFFVVDGRVVIVNLRLGSFIVLYFVFVSTNSHSQVVPYCSESDDFHDEAKEVTKDQGSALPFSKGFHLICQLVAALNPDDLDAMDECIPFTKFTLDNMLGFVSNDESYRHYFEHFVKAQMKRTIEIDSRTGMPSRLDAIRKQTRWDYEAFLMAEGTRRKIPQVAQVQRQLRQAAGR